MQDYTKLDLSDFIAKFSSHFARFVGLKIHFDINIFYALLNELDKLQFTPPSEVANIDEHLLLLQKCGILKLNEIAEFIKIIKYFLYLKTIDTSAHKHLSAFLGKIIIPSELNNLSAKFNKDGNLIESSYIELDSINHAISALKTEIKKQSAKILQKESLAPFLIDRQMHLINLKECLLLKSGFQKIINARVISRTQMGFFYAIPSAIDGIYERLEKLQTKRDLIIYEIEREISQIFSKHILFLKFINKEFECFDSLQARVNFAKQNDFNFIFPRKNSPIILRDFHHPNLKNPKSCNIHFKNKILLITGVNAGGKTMLLKSILSACFLAKFLIPFKIHSSSQIPLFNEIHSIINDPQNSSNDISTFAGRMLEFSKILHKDSMLLGIDEIELGTDANEASALYLALISQLQEKNNKIIITTHHKILASKMADNPSVSLISAIWDEKNELPTYQFLEDSIGKSYAFETAARYGISPQIIAHAKKLYGNNLENLNTLIEQTSSLKTKLLQKELELNEREKKLENKFFELDLLISKQNEQFQRKKHELENTYNAALTELKEVLKNKNEKEIHRFLNKANKNLAQIKMPKKPIKIELKKGDRVRYERHCGVILDIKNNIANIALDDGMRLKTNIENLAKIAQNKQDLTFNISGEKNACSVSLDLHGKRADEAIELLDTYISNCLLAGFDEVLIYHGIGSGILSRVVSEFLSAHPKVISFSDAPSSSGGFGAKIVRL